MGPSSIIFKNFLKPFIIFKDLVHSMWRIKRELMFLLSALTFAFSVFIVSGMVKIHGNYYRFLHRGIWEDVMVSRPHYKEFVSLKKLKRNFEAEKSRIKSHPKKLKALEKQFEQEIEMLKHEPVTLEATERAIHDALGKKLMPLIVSKRIEGRMPTSLNINKVLIDGKDVSRIHGQLDVWIEAFRAGNAPYSMIENLQSGSIILSKCLAEKLLKHMAPREKKIILHISKWGDFKTVNILKVNGVIDTGGKINAIFMKMTDVEKLGYPEGYNVIGLKVKKTKPSKIKKLLFDNMGEDYWIETASEKESITQMESFLITPYIVLSLFAIIMLINCWYAVIHSFEERKTQLDLLELHNYGRFRRLGLFSLLNLLPGATGFIGAIALIVFDWPVSLGGALIQINESLPYNLGRLEIFLNPMVLSILFLFLVIFWLMSWIFLQMKKSKIISFSAKDL